MSPADYRCYATECLKIAESLATAKDRAGLIAMAQAWLHLAHQAEKNSETVLVYETPEPRRHVAQQQQQIQPEDDPKNE
jgi:hypothetical protein